jgi:hypothetical protein
MSYELPVVQGHNIRCHRMGLLRDRATTAGKLDVGMLLLQQSSRLFSDGFKL